MKKLLFFWSKLSSTFWLLPTVIILFAIAAAIGFVYIDGFIDISREGIGRFLFVGSTESARNILTTVSGAMIGVAGTVFSITIVVLTLASSQLGPRLIKNFMYERINQIVLGSYVATFIYCLMVLNSINEYEDKVFIPSLSVLMALVAALGNIILLIVFIHHIAVSIQADTVISKISTSLMKNLETLFPESMGEELDEETEIDIASIRKKYGHSNKLKANKDGYLQYIDSDMIMKLCIEYDVWVELYFRPGDYLVKDVNVGTIYSLERLDDKDVKKFRHGFIAGKSRTHQQDAEHSILQLVEIAARALSSGVNDPYTAIVCIDNLTSTMRYLANARYPSKYRFDNDKNLRIIADNLSFDGMLDAAFNQIRQFSKNSPAVVIRLMDALVTINKFVKIEDRKKAIEKHARMVLNLGKQSFTELNDLNDLNERSEKILENV
jgi:uncharacterized membrane protein